MTLPEQARERARLELSRVRGSSGGGGRGGDDRDGRGGWERFAFDRGAAVEGDGEVGASVDDPREQETIASGGGGGITFAEIRQRRAPDTSAQREMDHAAAIFGAAPELRERAGSQHGRAASGARQGTAGGAQQRPQQPPPQKRVVSGYPAGSESEDEARAVFPLFILCHPLWNSAAIDYSRAAC